MTESLSRSSKALVPDWCDACQERTALTDRGTCPFCDAPLTRKVKRGGWKRPDLAGGKFTDPQLRVLHQAHLNGQSLNQLAKQVYANVGYTSHHSAAQAISAGFKRLGLPARDRIAAVKKACTIHGMAPKHGPRPGYGTYRRRLQRDDRPQCSAIKRQAPRKGERCDLPAMFGSEFCQSHDPQRELARQAAMVKMRRRQAKAVTMPIGPFADWLCALAAEHGSLRAVAGLTGLHYSSVCRYAKRHGTDGKPKATISLRVVEKAAGNAGVPLDAIYGQEAIAA